MSQPDSIPISNEQPQAQLEPDLHITPTSLPSPAPSTTPTIPITHQLQTIVLEPAPSPASSIAEDVSHTPTTSGSSGASSYMHSSASGGGGAPSTTTHPLWTHRVSASFSAMADQIAAASQAIALIPPLPDTMYSQLYTRMDEIEATQKRLEAEFSALREQMAQMSEGPEKFQMQLDELIASFKLEQDRLPARLQNSLVTISKVAIKPIVMSNGKFPPQFPATRGEFEHLTKERYEALMKSYNLPVKGDTAAKREAVRAFIGLPQ